MRSLLFNPFLFIAVAMAGFSAAANLYVFEGSHREYEYYIVYFLLLLTFLLTAGFQLLHRNRHLEFRRLELSPVGAHYIAALIIGSSVLEYALLGVPLFRQVTYAVFGFPLLHHISVSSWLLIFCMLAAKRTYVKIAYVAFAIANPILMLNRDVLLLTFFSIFVLLIIRRNISMVAAGLLGAIALVGFSVLGEWRSPNVIAAVALPYAYDLSGGGFVFYWISIYTTASAFNMLNNLNTKQDLLLVENINIFPEVFRWYVNFDLVGIVAFYLILAAINYVFFRLARQGRNFFLFYLYLNYQSIMTIFGVKYFLTNTLFTFLFLLGFHLAARVQRSGGGVPAHSLTARGANPERQPLVTA